MFPPTVGDMIQEIQSLKADRMRLRNRAQAAEMMLLEVITAAELDKRLTDGELAAARNIVRDGQGEWRSGF